MPTDSKGNVTYSMSGRQQLVREDLINFLSAASTDLAQLHHHLVIAHKLGAIFSPSADTHAPLKVIEEDLMELYGFIKDASNEAFNRATE